MPTRACRSQTSRREWLEEQEAGEEGEGEEGEGLPPVAAETAVTSSTAKSAAACHLEPSPASASDASSSGPVHALEHAGRGTEAARAVEASEDEDEIAAEQAAAQAQSKSATRVTRTGGGSAIVPEG